MATARGVVVLAAAGTFIQTVLDTNINADSKYGWAITGFRGILKSRDATGVEVPESNDIDLILSTRITTITTPDETEELARINWAVAFSTAVAFSIPELQKTAPIAEPRLTVQPNLYIGAKGSTAIGAITDIYYEVTYDIIKLSDMEVLRLLVGGV